MTAITLYDYWRSSASYRVRIALNLKQLAYSCVPVNLLSGDHQSAEHLKRHPQGLVPAIDIDGMTLTQSLAIIEFLDETFDKTPLLPADAAGRARVRTISHAIAMDIHPICNLHVVKHVVDLIAGGENAKKAWMVHFIRKGLVGIETLLDHRLTGDFCHGDTPGMADCCLIPQLYNASRWGADYAELENIRRIEANCSQLPAFSLAHPDNYETVQEAKSAHSP